MKFLKKNILVLVFCFITLNATYAQLFPRVRSSSPASQQLVLSAMRDAMCVIRYEYQLEDTASHERFNVEGKDYFGYSEGLCIKTKEGWIAENKVVVPWLDNKDVKKFPAYHPVISSVSVLACGDSTYKDLDYYPLNKRADIPSSSFVLVEDSVTFKEGLTIGERVGAIDGYIIWLTRTGNKLSIASYGHHLSDSLDSSVIDLQGKAIPSGAIGGIYVKQTIPEVGTIRFDLLGVLDKEDKNWRIVMINNPVPVMVQSQGKPKLVSASESASGEDKGLEKKRKDKKNKQ